jgi:hypothetical protein
MPKTKKLNDKIKYESEETNEVKRFIFILLGIIIVVLIVYGITKLTTKEDNSVDLTVTEGEINYSIVSIGTMLNKSDSEYYVMIYDQDSTQAVYYSALISKYTSEVTDALNVYFCNLGNKLNSSYYVGEDGETNPKAKEVKDLALGDLTLIKVKNGKITKYLEDIDAIKKELS